MYKTETIMEKIMYDTPQTSSATQPLLTQEDKKQILTDIENGLFDHGDMDYIFSLPTQYSTETIQLFVDSVKKETHIHNMIRHVIEATSSKSDNHENYNCYTYRKTVAAYMLVKVKANIQNIRYSTEF